MRFTTAQIRNAVVNPGKFAADARAQAAAPQRGGNAQRPWIDSALRSYFSGRRNQDEMWDSLNGRLSPDASAQKRSLIMGAVPLLEQFVEWDRLNAEMPIDCFPPVPDIPWKSHVLAVRRDLTYVTSTGFRVQQIMTDRELRLNQHASELFATALLISTDTDLGSGRVEQIDIWQLRHRQQRTWDRADLLPRLPDLEALLDEVSSLITTHD